MAASIQLTINKRQGQNQYYEERLAEGCRPLEMMQIPAGRFLMGSPEDELDRYTYEGPQHEVTIPQFFLARYPVTQAQWRIVAEMPQINRELDPNPARFKGKDDPVERVSWFDAVEFCDRLALHTNRQYRLPTEAEWEYACRAGTTTPFHFGETISTDLANYCGKDRTIKETDYSGSYGSGHKGEYRKRTIPVDYFDIANAFGLCDMHGNVWEWCSDHWHGNYRGAPIDGNSWLTDDTAAGRVCRGGSWNNNPRDCRVACRLIFPPEIASYNVGFRVSCGAPRTL